ncbi:hypothetical protein [Marinobacter salicampi]|uniref:hypothetical protein n=1 Tax=Marinobacter salicampi TaxID=435907 RepID=UPI00140B05F4|nr:hypothetical protein [Marinobacter salicampi]
MFWNLVATVFAGLGAAGIALGIRSITFKKAPKWIIPVFAGLGMMAYQVYIEYTWFDHMQARLPEGTVVVSSQEEQIFYRPWSYAFPQITSFTVLDKQSISRDLPDQDVVRFELYHFRHTYGGRISQGVYLANCSTGEMVPLDGQGKPKLDSVQKLNAEDPIRVQVCRK